MASPVTIENAANSDSVAVVNHALSVGVVAGSALIGTVSIDQTTYGSTNAVYVGGTTRVSVTPTITSGSAYTAGNEVGGLMTFASMLNATALSGVLESIAITCKSVQTAGFKLYIFGTNPTNSTWTDKTAPAINAADLPFLAGVYTYGGADSGLGTMTVYNLDSIGKAIVGATTSLYGILVTTGTPTFSSTSDITVSMTVLRD